MAQFKGGVLGLAGLAVAATSVPATAKSAPPQRNESARRQSMDDFVHMVFVEREPRKAYERYASPAMINHGMMGADRAGLIAGTERFMRAPGSLFRVENVLVDRDMTAVRYFGALDTSRPGAEVVEFFRWVGGKIVEHWDVVQVLSASTTDQK